ncbi:hypothetical protein BDQ17DRAFT_1360488 [Cyathus striatus]|nr:hypothetical protein BDQ17DRAFT_1360488 [Cyathus striatus]
MTALIAEDINTYSVDIVILYSNLMSLAEEKAKFPGQTISGIPPSPTIENPAQVFPKTDPDAGSLPQLSHNGLEKYAGNPFMIEHAFQKLDNSIRDVIGILEQEEKSQGDSQAQTALLAKFHLWKDEMEHIMAGTCANKAVNVVGKGREDRGGGMFTD